jgi:hypothetical protein
MAALGPGEIVANLHYGDAAALGVWVQVQRGGKRRLRAVAEGEKR